MSQPGFRLEDVLSYRESRLQQLQIRLAERERELHRQQTALAQLEAQADRVTRQTIHARGPLELHRLIQAREYLRSLEGRIDARRAAVAAAGELVEGARGEVVAAHREVETLRRLRERFQEELQASQQRRETLLIDEAALRRFTRQMGQGR